MSLQERLSRVDELRALSDGWHAHGQGRALTEGELAICEYLIREIDLRHLPEPAIFPRVEGGFVAEWYESNVSISFSVFEGTCEYHECYLNHGADADIWKESHIEIGKFDWLFERLKWQRHYSVTGALRNRMPSIAQDLVADANSGYFLMHRDLKDFILCRFSTEDAYPIDFKTGEVNMQTKVSKEGFEMCFFSPPRFIFGRWRD